MNAWQPLAGVRVLDFSVLLPGPFATLMLGDLGADVIKVEPPGGDNGRTITGLDFDAVNRNKRSIVLDLKDAASRPVVARLAARADIAIEAFRPGVADRLGIGYDDLRAHNEGLIYCSLTGYGQNGPDAMQPGHDLNYLAAGGMLTLPGHWEEPRPSRSGLPIADLAGGSYAAIAILAALHERAKTGRGVRLDLSLTEIALSFTAARRGLELNEHTRQHLYPTNDLFETADGRFIALGIVEEQFWEKFLNALGETAVPLRDPRFASEPSRREHGDALTPLLRTALRTRPIAEWMTIFERNDVPARPVLSPFEASRSPHMRARDLIVEREGQRHLPFPAIADGGRKPAVRSNAPRIGEHTSEILNELESEVHT